VTSAAKLASAPGRAADLSKAEKIDLEKIPESFETLAKGWGSPQNRRTCAELA